MTATVLPGFLDAHVHLALIDPSLLVRGGIARVLDLGGWPTPTPTPAPTPTQASDENLPEISYAHQFLTAPGGYPSRQSWTPPGSVAEVGTPADAVSAVAAQVTAGAALVKVALNSDAGPVPSDDVLGAIVERAHLLGVPVVAHAQGRGQAARAFTAGVDALAHTPFSEVLPDELVAGMARSMTWISTLDIHGWGDPTDDFVVATANLQRFHQGGGRVLYGTDLGNGPLPVGLNRREIEALLAAGLSPDEVLTALTDRGFGRPKSESARVTFIPGARPSDPSAFVDWLCTARAVSRLELEDLQ